MSARTKLNAIAVYGAVIVAAIAGGLAGSWTVFLIVFALVVAGGLHSGEIRPQPRQRRRR